MVRRTHHPLCKVFHRPLGHVGIVVEPLAGWDVHPGRIQSSDENERVSGWSAARACPCEGEHRVAIGPRHLLESLYLAPLEQELVDEGVAELAALRHNRVTGVRHNMRSVHV